MEEIKLRDEFIKLGQAIKAANLVQDGVEAKFVIQDGLVKVNGETDTRRGRKLYDGDVVSFNGEEIKRVYLGISMADISTSLHILKQYNINLSSSINKGVIVIGCEEGTPAYDGGIRKGDVITMINNYSPIVKIT